MVEIHAPVGEQSIIAAGKQSLKIAAPVTALTRWQP